MKTMLERFEAEDPTPGSSGSSHLKQKIKNTKAPTKYNKSFRPKINEMPAPQPDAQPPHQVVQPVVLPPIHPLPPALNVAPPPPQQIVQDDSAALNMSSESFPEDNLNDILDNITQRYTPKMKKSTFIYGELAEKIVRASRAAKIKNPYERHLLEISPKDEEVSILGRIVCVGLKTNVTRTNGGKNFSFSFSAVDVNNTSIEDHRSVMRGTLFSKNQLNDWQNRRFSEFKTKIKVGAVLAFNNFSCGKTCHVPVHFKPKVTHPAQISMDVTRVRQSIETIGLQEVYSSEDEEMYVRPRDLEQFNIPEEITVLADVRAATENRSHPSRKKLLSALRNLLQIDTDKPFYYTIATEVVFFYVANNESTDGHRLNCCICLKNLMTRRRSRNCKVVEFAGNPLGRTTISNFKCLIHLNHFDYIID